MLQEKPQDKPGGAELLEAAVASLSGTVVAAKDFRSSGGIAQRMRSLLLLCRPLVHLVHAAMVTCEFGDPLPGCCIYRYRNGFRAE